MSNVFPTNDTERKNSRKVSPILIFFISLGALLLFGWVAFPELLYDSHSQPVDFNHKTHAKIADNSCESCHSFRPDGSFTGIPGIENCKTCHVRVEKGTVNEVHLIQDYIEKEAEIPWHVYARQPDSVFFSHAAHVKSADLTCDTCHGEIGQSTTLKAYEKNVFTGYSRDIWGSSFIMAGGMRMDDCVDCHRKMEHEGASVQTEKEGCFVCHK